MTHPLPKLYETSTFQQYYYQRNQQQLYSVFIVAAQYSLSTPFLGESQDSPHSLDKFNLLIHHALTQLLTAHPTLLMNVFDEEPAQAPPSSTNETTDQPTLPLHPKSQFVSLILNLSFSNLVTHHTLPPNYTTSDLESFINMLQQRQIRNYGRNDNVTWQIHILNREWVFVAFDHLLYDGLSGAHFHQEFSKYLSTSINHFANNPQVQVESDFKQHVESTPLWTFHNFCTQNVKLSSIPKALEHYFDCNLGWGDYTTALCNEVMPTPVKRIASSLYQTIFPDHKFVYNANSNSDLNTALFAFQPLTADDGTTPISATTPALPTPTYLPGNFANQVRLVKISQQKLNFIRDTVLRPHKIRFSAFLLYLISIAMLPITGMRSLGFGIPMNVRQVVKPVYDQEQLRFDATSPVCVADTTEQHQQQPQSDPLLFGCFVGFCSFQIKSPATLLKSLQNALAFSAVDQPLNDAEISRFEQIRDLIDAHKNNTIASQSSSSSSSSSLSSLNTTIVDTDLLNHLSTTLDQQLNTPTSGPNGFFHSLGMLNLGKSIFGIQQTVQNLSKSPRSGTVELSNLGTVKFAAAAAAATGAGTDSDSSGATVKVVDMIFTQPSACPGNYITFNAVGLETSNAGKPSEHDHLTLSIAAIPQFTDERIDRVVQLFQHLINNLEYLF